MRFLKFSKTQMIVICLFVCAVCAPVCAVQSEWAETTATFVAVEDLSEDGFAFTIDYPIPESTAVNKDGDRIQGPIQQHGILEKKPVLLQKVKIRYLKEEPVIFEWVDEIQYSEVASSRNSF